MSRFWDGFERGYGDEPPKSDAVFQWVFLLTLAAIVGGICWLVF